VNCEDSDPALYGNGRFDRFGFADGVGSLLYSLLPPVPFCSPSSGGQINRYSHGVSKIPIVLSDYGVLKSPKHRHKAGSGSRLRVGGKAKGSEKDRHAQAGTCVDGSESDSSR